MFYCVSKLGLFHDSFLEDCLPGLPRKAVFNMLINDFHGRFWPELLSFTAVKDSNSQI